MKTTSNKKWYGGNEEKFREKARENLADRSIRSIFSREFEDRSSSSLLNWFDRLIGNQFARDAPLDDPSRSLARVCTCVCVCARYILDLRSDYTALTREGTTPRETEQTAVVKTGSCLVHFLDACVNNAPLVSVNNVKTANITRKWHTHLWKIP